MCRMRKPSRKLLGWLLGWAIIGIGLLVAVGLEAERLHVVEYGVIGVSVGAWAPSRGWSRASRALLGVASALALGAAEETLQAWLPDRVGQWRDVLLDGIGGCMGAYASIPWAPRR